MKIGLMCPMKEEAEFIAKQLERPHRLKLLGTQVQEGMWHNFHCIVMQSGLGKVAAAAGTQALIDTCQVGAVFVVGLAGALDPALRIGDIVIADELIQHDLDVRPLFDYTVIPDLGLKSIETDRSLRQAAFSAAEELAKKRFPTLFSEEVKTRFGLLIPQVKVGPVLTGDQFVSGDGTGRLRQLFPKALCVEMEGAAAAQVCLMNSVPLAVLRVISDRADHKAQFDFTGFLNEVAGKYGFALLDLLLSRHLSEDFREDYRPSGRQR